MTNEVPDPSENSEEHSEEEIIIGKHARNLIERVQQVTNAYLGEHDLLSEKNDEMADHIIFHVFATLMAIYPPLAHEFLVHGKKSADEFFEIFKENVYATILYRDEHEDDDDEEGLPPEKEKVPA